MIQMIEMMWMMQMIQMMEIIQINNYSYTAIFYLVTFEVIFSFSKQMIQINNYLQVALFLFSNIDIKNYLTDFILLILATIMDSNKQLSTSHTIFI